MADLLQFLEIVRRQNAKSWHDTDSRQRSETNFYSGPPLQALSTLVYSDNVDLQRSASLTFAEITERGMSNVLEHDNQEQNTDKMY